MPRPKSKKNRYFDEDVQDAIIEYNSNPDNHSLRNRIYADRIHYAFDKLAENIINTFKFSYFDYGFTEVKNEVVSFLVLNIHKYDHTKGSKAFSYFSIVAKNYLILNNNSNYKKLKSHVNLDDMNTNQTNSLHTNSGLTKTDGDFMSQFINYLEMKVPTIFKKRKDIDISYAIIELMRQREEIENFNKKSLYILIREMTGVETSQITRVVNVLKNHYRKVHKEYLSKGIISKSQVSQSFF
tara:strand:+ start:685 stop:1404 length:720 start_codon:yes stop_codon:yes gene_type:complete